MVLQKVVNRAVKGNVKANRNGFYLQKSTNLTFLKG